MKKISYFDTILKRRVVLIVSDAGFDSIWNILFDVDTVERIRYDELDDLSIR